MALLFKVETSQRFAFVASGQQACMTDDEQRLIEEARRSREDTEQLREEGAASEPDESDPPSEAGNPWAKTSSGDSDSITDAD